MCGCYAVYECVELSLMWPWEWDCREQWSGFCENCDNCGGVSAIVLNGRSHTCSFLVSNFNLCNPGKMSVAVEHSNGNRKTHVYCKVIKMKIQQGETLISSILYLECIHLKVFRPTAI
jgi:hypothetical protein